jgi:FixJ family two-component response regulator
VALRFCPLPNASGLLEWPGMDAQGRVLVVDDDPVVLRALDRTLRSFGFTVEAFVSPSAFLDRLPVDGPACVVLDLRMPGLTGLDVQEAMAQRDTLVPVIFLSALADVPSTVKAMRDGALDFLVKPVDEEQLRTAVLAALVRAGELHDRRSAERALEARFARLTRREHQVCLLVADGLLNKQIAAELGTSLKTIKAHRGRMMHKLEVDSVAGLVRLLAGRPRSRPV